MELMVSISILILIIGAVGVVFSGASNSVGTSQALMEQMASVRAIQSQIDRDLHALDRSGFLVIRSRIINPNANPNLADRAYRCDQLCFMATGTFPNRTGADTPTPFTDSSLANGAIIWWGHGVMESAQPPDSSYLLAAQNNLPGGWMGVLPTGVFPNGTIKESECTLLRHVRLLYPGPASGGQIKPAGNALMAYADATLNAANISGSQPGEGPANITSSRYAAVAQTSAQVQQDIAARRANDALPEVDQYTYRFRALASVYDTEKGSFVNGYFRMTPLVMAGVSSFRVEWTDGTVYPNGSGAQTGQLAWYGPTMPGTNAPLLHGGPNPDTNMELYNNGNLIGGINDQYVACFNSNNRALWPKALRITMHIASDRLGGRDFTQIVNLP